MHFQYWPINTVNVSLIPYVSHDTTSGLFGSVLERYFLSSKASKGYLVKDPTGTKPALTTWWEGINAGVIDFTNPSAAEWFLSELWGLQELGVDSFKFDGGETTYLPLTPYKLFNNAGNPDTYVTAYARTIATADKMLRQEYRTGVQTQDLPLMVRMIDKTSTWGYGQGFKTLITTALTFSIFGYPFVLPDYIGGNGYNGDIPDSELYIRWVQANALMPIMQFSYTPWFFQNDTVVKVTRDMIALHEQYADKIIALAKDSIITGDPIIRPMWWIAPNDIPALTCDSQFMLGNDVLVAPVLDKGVTERQIYLPVGTWKDELTGKMINGPVTLNYAVTLEDLPRFTKAD
ncbi:myogenesis-regulating glycosidase [Patella vulgata]|uniref:myogenesis-regulating glycosidase n=1 Tax=Patella vulgata TaxID=6465 RepID=UPI0024A92285|nr:myogenesis-regulating glycosidase [Patella vulgata]